MPQQKNCCLIHYLNLFIILLSLFKLLLTSFIFLACLFITLVEIFSILFTCSLIETASNLSSFSKGCNTLMTTNLYSLSCSVGVSQVICGLVSSPFQYPTKVISLSSMLFPHSVNLYCKP